MATTRIDLPGELWKPIPDYEGIYDVSNLGRVWSVPRWTLNSLGINKPVSKGLILKQRRGEWYYSICLSSGGRKSRAVRVHRLVCEVFNGPPPGEGYQCAHINGDPLDNRACNLMWATPLENSHHKFGHGTVVRGSLHVLSKLNEDSVLRIRKSVREGCAQAEVARRFSVSPATICRIMKGEIWAHV